MFINNINIYNKKNYRYDTDDVDLFSEMFNEEIHDNDMTPYKLDKYICMYCNTYFPSRNKLFYHLNFMNINTRPLINSINKINNEDEYLKKLNKIKKLKKKRCFWIVKKRLKKSKRLKKKMDIKNLTFQLDRILIN